MTARDPERPLRVTLLILAIAALSLWLLGELAGILGRVADVALVFIFAWAVAYLLGPPIAWLDARTRLGRLGAVAVVYGGLLLVTIAILALAVPVIAAQLAGLVERAPQYGDALAERVRAVQAELQARGIQVDVVGLYGALPARIADVAATGAADALGLLGGVFTVLLDVTLVLIVAFFMLIDGERLWRQFLAVLPRDLTSEAELLRRGADRSFGGFLRGQLLLGLLYGILSWLLFAAVGLQFAALLGVASGLLMVIPFFGAIIAMLPPVLVAIAQGGQAAILTFLGLIVLQNVILNIVGPRLMAHTVGIHPLFVFLALLLGARVAGLWGVFLALPLAGVLNIFARYFMEVAQGQRVRSAVAARIPEAEAAEISAPNEKSPAAEKRQEVITS